MNTLSTASNSSSGGKFERKMNSKENSFNHSSSHGHGGKGVKSLPCFTHLATGSCIYEDHCCFIHDRRVTGNVLANTTLDQRNSVDHRIREDPLYWPPTHNTHRAEEYTLDPKIVYHDDLRYKAIFSMWTFFVGNIANEHAVDWPNQPVNHLTKRNRLPVFVELGEGNGISQKVEKKERPQSDASFNTSPVSTAISFTASGINNPMKSLPPAISSVSKSSFIKQSAQIYHYRSSASA